MMLTYAPYIVLSFALVGFLMKAPMLGSSSDDSCNNWTFCQEKCIEGYDKKALRCYKKCSDKQVDVGLLCRDKCREGYKDVAGVCWFDKCPSGQEKQGTLCYQKCRDNEKQIGCCLCREKCRSGYREVLGVCWKGLKPYTPKTRTRTSDAKLASYTPPSPAKKSYTPKTSVGNYLKYLLFGISAMGIVLVVAIIKLIIKLVASVVTSR
jgi:hypothetical protein